MSILNFYCFRNQLVPIRRQVMIQTVLYHRYNNYNGISVHYNLLFIISVHYNLLFIMSLLITQLYIHFSTDLVVIIRILSISYVMFFISQHILHRPATPSNCWCACGLFNYLVLWVCAIKLWSRP